MEIELKYAIPNHETFERLLALRRLGDYDLRVAGEKQQADHYLDTRERQALRGGYAVRLREDLACAPDNREPNMRNAPAQQDGLFLVPKVIE